MMDAAGRPTFDEALKLDAEKVARRTLRHKFGRLSNRRILATLRAADEDECYLGVSDAELLDRWFTEYEAALRRLRSASILRTAPP